MRVYTANQTIIANLPYAAMLLIGAATIAAAFGFSAAALAGAAGYVAYGVAGTLWVMIFICPYCAYYATRSCPCGYGLAAARLARKGDRECFAAKFRRHIPVIFALWAVPMVCGGIALWHSFSWQVAGLMAAFAIDAYVILPLLSKRHSCAECPQRDECPWMARRKPAAG